MQDTQTIIGVMADSHGRPNVIAGALELFAAQGCTQMYHLGDVCDSMTPETSDACMDLLIQAKVLAVKGNNDHAVVVNQWGMKTGLVREDTLQRLKSLPMALSLNNADLAHSLPFIKEMGLSAMVRAMDRTLASVFFRQKPQGLLFRGHSHEPTLTHLRNGKVHTQPLTPGKTLDLTELRPCVVTCGALTRGHALIWAPESDTLRSFSF